MQRYLGTPNLAWDFLTLADPERWDAYFAAADQPRAEGADFWVGGRRYGLFAHDFRQVPVERPAGADNRARTRARHHAVPVDKSCRRCWCSPNRSSTTPCDRRCVTCADRICWRATRCCGPAWSTTEPETRSRPRKRWRRWYRAAVETLREHPRDDKLWRAVERTYVRPAATQERAAAALGLPFSTYRRHLTQGVDRVVAWLWDQEIYGEHH